MKKFRVEIKLKDSDEKNNLTLILQAKDEQEVQKLRRKQIGLSFKEEDIDIQSFEI